MLKLPAGEAGGDAKERFCIAETGAAEAGDDECEGDGIV